jgi:ubiquinone/menaquinone biosynthesis C-methylase UbiE
MNPEKLRVRRLYDTQAGVYDRMSRGLEWLGLRALRREVFGRARGAVLDVAVGTGLNLPFYGPAVTDVTAIDLSPGMLERAGRRSARLRVPVRLETGDAEQLPFPDRSFDTVASALSTCTFPDPLGALREMGRVCRTDGRILLLEHGRSRVAWMGRFQDRRAARHAELLGCHWNREPLDLVRQAGLRVVHARRIFFGIFHLIEAAPPDASNR